MGLGKGYALFGELFVVSSVTARSCAKPFFRFGGQVRVVCEYVAHGVGTGFDSGFTHSQIFVYFQWIVTVGNVVHHLRIDADIVGCDVSGQLVHFFLPGEIRIFQSCGFGVGENRRFAVR